MLFNSYIFILFFFPLCLAGFYLLEKRGWAQAARIWLIGFSLWFYGYFNLYYLSIMVGSIVFNYAVYQLLIRIKKRKKAVLALGVCANLAILFYFKYFDFFVENINGVFHTGFLVKNILLPLGISFFTFQQIGFLVDTWRGETEGCSFVEYALFVSFFPQLIAGPIVNYGEMIPQFRQIGRRSFSWETFTRGLYLFTLGMAKKVLLADTFGLAVNYGYGNTAALSSADALLVMLFYTIQLYFDFSGYCDMARGLGHMMGIEIPVNFNSPYKASNIIDFWKRWHITLNRFLMRYVYIPLGGNRKGRRRMLLNLLLVFLISGLWHGAGWTYVIWGAMHGVVYVATRIWQLYRQDRAQKKSSAAQGNEDQPPVADGNPKRRKWTVSAAHGAGVFFTYLFMNVSCIFFRSADLTQAEQFFTRIFQGGWKLPAAGISSVFNLEEFWYVMKILRIDRLPGSEMYLCIAFTLFSLGVIFFHKNAAEMAERFRPKGRNMLATAVLFLWCVLSLSGVSSFLYFNF